MCSASHTSSCPSVDPSVKKETVLSVYFRLAFPSLPGFLKAVTFVITLCELRDKQPEVLDG